MATYRASVDLEPAVVRVPWSGWRGGSLQGVSESDELPTNWSAHDNVRWRTSVPGRGNSSPVVGEGRVFLTSVIGTDGGDQATVIAIGRANGEVQWQCPVGTPQGSSHSKNGFASATPLVDADRVYAAFGGLGLVAVTYDGHLLWQTAFPQQRHEWGAAASPLLFESLVIHVIDGDTESAIVALDKRTGQEVWRTKRASRGSWSSPVLFNAGTAEVPQWQVIVNGTGGGHSGEVIAYDPLTGGEIWKVAGTTDIPCPTAIVGDGLVISSSGSNGPVFCLRPQAGRTTETLWRNASGGPYVPTGVIYRGRLFMVSDAGLVACVNLTDGSNVWRKRLQGTFSASLVAGGGNIYATNERGDVYVFKAGDKFELVATNRLHQPCMATPALAEDEIFLRTQTHLYCVAATTALAAEAADIAPTVDPTTIRSPADVGSAELSAPPSSLSSP